MSPMTTPCGAGIDDEDVPGWAAESFWGMSDMSYASILTASQIGRIRAFAIPREVTAGEILYEPGDDTPPVFVVISGGIKILAVGGVEERTVPQLSLRCRPRGQGQAQSSPVQLHRSRIQ